MLEDIEQILFSTVRLSMIMGTSCLMGFRLKHCPGSQRARRSGNVSGTRTASVFISESGTFSAKADWLASATARLGYAWAPRWLLYIKGGAAWVHDKYNVDRQIVVLGVANPFTYVASETRAGWTVGGGVEWAFADHWSTRLEYQFYDFGSRELAFVSNRTDPNKFVNVEQQIHTLKLGVNYRF